MPLNMMTNNMMVLVYDPKWYWHMFYTRHYLLKVEKTRSTSKHKALGMIYNMNKL